MAERIDDVRGSRRGQVFLPAMEGQLKQISPSGRWVTLLRSWTTISEFDIDINENYNKQHALATMPPNILLRCRSPKDLQYACWTPPDSSTGALTSSDEIPYALRCRDCVPEPRRRRR